MKRILFFVLPVVLFWRLSPCFGASVEIGYNGGDGCQDFVTTTVGQGFTANCVGTTLSGTTVVEASATLALVKLHLESTGQTTVPGKSALIRVIDTLTVTGGSGSGTLVWKWAMDGTLDASDGIYSQVYFSNLGGGAFADFRACGSNVQFGSFICVFDAAPDPPGGLRGAQPHETVDETKSISIPFTFGVPLNVDWRLQAAISSGCTFGNNCNLLAYSVGGNVDFFNTAQLQPLVVLDSGGNQIFGASALSTSGFNYPVEGAPTTAPPVLGAIGNKTVNEGAMLVFTATATDSDVPANTLTFSLDSGAPAGAAITSAGFFSWIPTEAQGPGSYPLTVRVTDDGSPAQSDSEQITITVNEVNSPPVLAAIGNKTVKVGSLLTFTATATDPDLPTNTLTFSLAAGAPAGATMNSTTGVFTWQPSNKQGKGNYAVTVRVTDSGSPAQSDSEAITITVLKKGGKPE